MSALLLSPAIRVMKRLRFTGKSALVVLVLRLDKEIVQSRQELAGVLQREAARFRIA